MDQNNYLDRNGLSRYSDSIASIIKDRLALKANLSDVITIDYVDNNFVKLSVYNPTISSIQTSLNSKIGADYTYSKAEVDELLQGYMPQPSGSDTYATQSWVTTNLTNTLSSYVSINYLNNQGFATQTWVNNQGFATQSWVISQLPNLSNYYTISEIDNLLNDYATLTITNNLTNQLIALTNTVNSLISGGGGSSESGFEDLNNLYWWVHMKTNQLAIHSGQSLNENPSDPDTPYGREFVTADMYRRNSDEFKLVTYSIKIDADITRVVGGTTEQETIEGLSYDFSSPTVLSTYCDETVKNYFDNALIINNNGVYDSSLTQLFTASAWNEFISNYGSGAEHLIIDREINISGTLLVSLWPFNKDTQSNLDPDDPTAEDDRYTWVFRYKTNTWDTEPTNTLELRLYQNNSDTWVNDPVLNNTVKAVYNTSGYYTLLESDPEYSNYFDDQKYVDVSLAKNSSNNKYYFTFGQGLNKVSVLKSVFIDTLNAYSDRVSSDVFKIFVNGVELTTSAADLDIISDFATNYLISNDESFMDSRVSDITLRFGQNLIYYYIQNYPTARDLFEFLSESNKVSSLGGKTGVITFNDHPSSNEVAFEVDSNNVMKGFIPPIPDAVPVGSIHIWPDIQNLNPPSGYLLCDGSNVSQSTYSTLYGIIGNTYDDTTTQAGEFRLPDMRNIIQGMNFIIKP